MPRRCLYAPTTVAARRADRADAVIGYRLLRAIGLSRFLRTVYRIEVTGSARIPAEGPCILAANHESLIDPFILGVVTTRPIRYLAKAELFRRRLLGAVLHSLGVVSLARGAGDVRAMSEAELALANGDVVGIFPQGTCLPYRHRPFFRGAARLALATGAPLVPVCLVGTERALRPHRVRVGFPKLRILVGEPLRVTAQRPTAASARELTGTLEEAIDELRRPFGEPAHVWIAS